ncbi:MAG: hypothetical protein EXR21_10380 [Flavobacteriaceae bacterium]|nr:hypothetical protein [Flavobacteriaceae bacterium]
MPLSVPTNSQPCIIRLKFSVPVGMAVNVRVRAIDSTQSNTVFLSSIFKIHGTTNPKKVVEVRLPIAPAGLNIECSNPHNGFSYDGVEVEALKTYPICTTPETGRFIKFVKDFCLTCGVLDDNTEFRSSTEEFKIKYLKGIFDQKKGKYISTPARVSLPSKIIEVNSIKFRNYTVPARMMLLLHEYSHVFLNKRPEDETEADINGLYLYLGMGFNQAEAIGIWNSIFTTADTLENRKRNAIIHKYIQNYDKMKLWKC